MRPTGRQLDNPDLEGHMRLTGRQLDNPDLEYFVE